MADSDRHRDRASMRTSVSLPRSLYSEVERIAGKNKVSIAWVIRDAVEKYVAEEAPLFRRALGPENS